MNEEIQKKINQIIKAVLQLEQEGKRNIDEIKAKLIQSEAMCIRMLLNLS